MRNKKAKALRAQYGTKTEYRRAKRSHSHGDALVGVALPRPRKATAQSQWVESRPTFSLAPPVAMKHPHRPRRPGKGKLHGFNQGGLAVPLSPMVALHGMFGGMMAAMAATMLSLSQRYAPRQDRGYGRGR